jgi:membrane protease YdiL (CAAX protease family)
VALALLFRDDRFDRGDLYRLSLNDEYLHVVTGRFFVLAVPLLAIGRWLTPAEFLLFPRKRPGLWLMFAVLYPVLSAVPQGILFRVYFLQEFGSLFTNHAALVVAGAIVFSLGHLVFRNVPALIITALGGALFIDTYVHTHSMMLSAIEHGVYGTLAFTAGLGKYLYLGERPSVA